MLATSYEVTNNWGCALCGFFPPLHSVYCSNSAWSVCWWLFNKSLLKKNCLLDKLLKTQNAAIPLDQPKAWCWAHQARCTGLSVRLPNQTNCPDSWDSIFDINKWLGQSPLVFQLWLHSHCSPSSERILCSLKDNSVLEWLRQVFMSPDS